MGLRSGIFSRLERPFFNLTISHKLGAMLTLPSAAVLIVLASAWIGMDVLSAVRSYVGGEGLWSKAQKQASYRIMRYVTHQDPADYQKFLGYLAIPEGDRRARLELEKPRPSFEVIHQGFVDGGLHPDDIPGMIRLFRYFRREPHMDQAIAIWEQGDRHIVQLREVGEQIHAQIASGQPSPAELKRLAAEAELINDHLTPLENAFSATLSDAARWVKWLLLLAIGTGGVGLTSLGLLIAALIARHLSTRIERLRSAAVRVAAGDFSEQVEQPTKDEIGDLSTAFQQMMSLRARAEANNEALNEMLEERLAAVRLSNRELEAFSYSVSHDLRAPLRAIDGFAGILADDHTAQLDEEGKRLLAVIRKNVQQMSALIDGLLTFSKLNQRPLKRERINMTALANEVVAEQMAALEAGRQVQLTVDTLGTAEGDPTLLRQVFANLFSNALKFTRGRADARIDVGYRVETTRDVYFVRDNGAGFDMQYADKLFGVFQRLHSTQEFEGTGVGLALVQRIVSRHGGQVWAEGVVDKGATFYFSLPISTSPTPVAEIQNP